MAARAFVASDALSASSRRRAPPSENGKPQVRLRSPEQVASARPSVRRRLVRPLPLIGVLLVLVALAGYWSVYSATTARTPVLVAAHDLQAGAVLRPVRSAYRRARRRRRDDGVARSGAGHRDGAGAGARGSGPAGRAARARLGGIAGARRPAAFTLVVPALRALGGSLRPGDRVTVLATFDSGAGAQARAIARGLRVLTVGEAPEGLDRASASIPVTVALSNPSLAAGLALANTEGKIDLLREGGKRQHSADPAGERAGRLLGWSVCRSYSR